jgi:hypothetical protein
MLLFYLQNNYLLSYSELHKKQKQKQNENEGKAIYAI